MNRLLRGGNGSVGPYFKSMKHSDKYGSGNIISRYLVHNFMSEIKYMVASASPKDIHEVGCGEGQIIGMLARCGYSSKGTDICWSSILSARNEAEQMGLKIDLDIKSIFDLDAERDCADMIVCCEVLEHLTDPELAIKKIVSLAKRDIILSVPREPIWHMLNLLRGKYIHALGNTTGHYNHWTRNMFVDFVACYADVVSVRSPLPWTIVHCRPKN